MQKKKIRKSKKKGNKNITQQTQARTFVAS